MPWLPAKSKMKNLISSKQAIKSPSFLRLWLIRSSLLRIEVSKEIVIKRVTDEAIIGTDYYLESWACPVLSVLNCPVLSGNLNVDQSFLRSFCCPLFPSTSPLVLILRKRNPARILLNMMRKSKQLIEMVLRMIL